MRSGRTLEAEIEHNRTVFAELIRVAASRAERGRLESSIEWCRVAASFAMTNAVGTLRSAELESVIDVVAAKGIQPGPGARPSGENRRCLHVVSEASAIGGSTRLVERWIQRDDTAESSVVVTRQPSVIERLATAARSSGGEAIGLGADERDSIARAEKLRSMAGQYDLVVCHLHSDDVVAAAAFGEGYAGPPVVLYNHADHLFWLAGTRLTAVVDARSAGAMLTHEARGYRHEDSLLLPLPVPRQPSIARDPGEGGRVVAVSVARPIKFQDTLMEPRFAELVSGVLDDNPDLDFRAVGPGPEDAPWPALIGKYGARIQVTGPVPDPGPHLRASDIYFDTFPFSSTTSMLEAAAASLPTITLDAHTGFLGVLGLADFIEEEENRPKTTTAFFGRVRDLVASPDLRAVSGARAREGYLETTDEAPWREALHKIVDVLSIKAATGTRIGDAPVPPGDGRMNDLSVALLEIEQRVPLLASIAGSLPRFDTRDRVTVRLRWLVARAVRKASTRPWTRFRDPDLILIPSARRSRRVIASEAAVGQVVA